MIVSVIEGVDCSRENLRAWIAEANRLRTENRELRARIAALEEGVVERARYARQRG